VLAHRLLRNVEVRSDLASGEFVAAHELQHLSSMRISERAQHRIRTRSTRPT